MRARVPIDVQSCARCAVRASAGEIAAPQSLPGDLLGEGLPHRYRHTLKLPMRLAHPPDRCQPARVLGLSVAAEDGVDIHKCDWPQQEAGGLECVRWHNSSRREALVPSFRRMKPIVDIVCSSGMEAFIKAPIGGRGKTEPPVRQHHRSSGRFLRNRSRAPDRDR